MTRTLQNMTWEAMMFVAFEGFSVGRCYHMSGWDHVCCEDNFRRVLQREHRYKWVDLPHMMLAPSKVLHDLCCSLSPLRSSSL